MYENMAVRNTEEEEEAERKTREKKKTESAINAFHMRNVQSIEQTNDGCFFSISTSSFSFSTFLSVYKLSYTSANVYLSIDCE